MACSLLVLGASHRVGRAVAAEARRRRWQVFLADGDADSGAVQVSGAGRLERRRWDAVIDAAGWGPQVLAESAVLTGAVGRYVYLSAVSDYASRPGESVTEESPLRQPAAEREAAVRAREGRWTVLHVGEVLDPFDPAGSLAWWLARVERGGRVLAPGDPGRLIQPVDVRDVAAFVCGQALAGRREVMTVAAPPGHTTVGALLQACVAASGAGAELCWVDDEALVQAGVGPAGVPWWSPAPTARIGARRAERAGLVCRPVEESVADAWWNLAAGRRLPVALVEAAMRGGLTTQAAEAILAERGPAVGGGPRRG
jgi:nucleoside-diphosphate-sugar epimerase